MENNFLKNLKDVSNEKLTENGAFALKSTNSALMDLFGTIGAMREQSEEEIVMSFLAAYSEDRLLAMKMLFYARDIRGGLGERDIPRIIFKYLANNHKKDMQINMHLISEFGRWDDYYAFVGTPLEGEAFALMKSQFERDLKSLSDGENVSLLAKWLKSQNTSSKESRHLGKLTAKYFYPEILNENTRSSRYRHDLSKLRKKINIVEAQMSANNWDKIQYSQVPAKASSIYSDAFMKHDEERYNAFLHDVSTGDAKINTSTLYPYDLVRKYRIGCRTPNATVEEQWKNLPNYITNNKNFLIMADTSGSMTGLPMDVAVSLAIYFAERTTSGFKNHFMTFSEEPELIALPVESNLLDKVRLVMKSRWGMNTDLEAAFNKILKTAIRGKLSQEDMPDALVVITDMEIDDFNFDDEPIASVTFTDEMKKRFEDAGYVMPTIVWWNVSARQNTFHANYTDSSVRFISGCSASIFESLCERMGDSPEELMLLILNSERYEAVKISV